MKTVEVEHTPRHKVISDLFSLEGKTAIVTGAAQGIGAEIGLRLSEAGASLVLLDINERKVENTAKEIAAESGGRVIGCKANVDDLPSLLDCADRACEEFGSLDIWVNNAGIFPPQDPVDVSSQEFLHVLDINLLGAQMGSEAAINEMRRNDHKGGVIINIASTPAFTRSSSYRASSSALFGLTRFMASEMGQEGIRVVAIAPTITETPGVEKYERLNPKATKEKEALIEELPLGRAAKPDDIARAALFLASDAASFITGVVLPVDGGETAKTTL